jgi:hypothetical protein
MNNETLEMRDEATVGGIATGHVATAVRCVTIWTSFNT